MGASHRGLGGIAKSGPVGPRCVTRGRNARRRVAVSAGERGPAVWRSQFARCLALSVIFLTSPYGSAGARAVDPWPSFRGPNASGVAEGFAAPTTWDVDDPRDLRWKTAIPGLGHSSPVIWGDRVFVTTAVSGKENPELKVGLYGNIAPVEDDTVHTWRVLALDKDTGRIVWERVAHEGVPKIKRHTKATHANCTPATDGKHIVAFFGSEGLYCYDWDGTLKWKKDFGVLDSGYYVVPQAQWEFGSSPIIHDGKVVVQCDVQGDSFLAAFDIESGAEAWRTPRDEVPTWSTPTIYAHNGQTRLAVNGYKHIGGYDLATGKEVWRMRGGGDIPVPTPVVSDGLIYITNAHGMAAPLLAIRTSATRDITLPSGESKSDAVAWSYDRRGTYMQSVVVYRGLLYACRDNGVLTVYDAKTGDIRYRERLGDGRTGFTASPVAADGKVYFTSEEGEIYVLAAGPEFKLLAVNKMNEVCMATLAISDGSLFVRTSKHVYAIAAAASAPSAGSD